MLFSGPAGRSLPADRRGVGTNIGDGDVRTGGHWPVDQTAGLLVAASLLTVFYSVGIAALRREQDEELVAA